MHTVPAVHMYSMVAIPPKVSIRTYRRSVAGGLRHNLWGPLSLDVVTTTTRLAADYSRQQVMEGVVIGSELPLGSLEAPHKGVEFAGCALTAAGSILHSIRSDRRSHHSYHKLFNPRLPSQQPSKDV